MRRSMVIGLEIVLGLAAAWAWADDGNAPPPAAPPGTVASATMAADENMAGQIAEWVKQLGSSEYADRESAQSKLIGLGWSAVPALREAATDKNPEIANRAAGAIEAILDRIETRRDSLRAAAEQSVKDKDLAAARKQLLDLLAVPEPQRRDARTAMQFFEKQQDWAALATAYAAAADAVQRAVQSPVDAFIRPAPQQPADAPGMGPMVQVQVDLDGRWSDCKGEGANWKDSIRRKQKELDLERLAVLKRLGVLCMDRLNSPKRAAEAYATSGQGVPLCTEPIDKLIPGFWPRLTADGVTLLAMDHVGAPQFRLEMLDGLADAQAKSGDLRAAAETRIRAMLASLLDCKGDWNAHGPATQSEKFWQVARRLPTNEPLPPTLWLHVLDANKPAMEFDSPEAGPHHYPLSFPGPRLVIRPGQRARRLTVSADMETPGGGGCIRCFTMIDGKVTDLGDVLWRQDKPKGREWLTSTFEVPKDVGIIRLAIAPFSGSEFHVHAIKVRAEFDTEPNADGTTAPQPPPTTQPATSVP